MKSYISYQNNVQTIEHNPLYNLNKNSNSYQTINYYVIWKLNKKKKMISSNLINWAQFLLMSYCQFDYQRVPT